MVLKIRIAWLGVRDDNQTFYRDEFIKKFESLLPLAKRFENNRLGSLVKTVQEIFGWGGGIRTPDHGTRTRCLTAWLHPIGLANYSKLSLLWLESADGVSARDSLANAQ